MYTSRRTFLKKSALAAAGTTLLSSELFAAKKAKEILGVQLYSVRDDMKSDPLGTLKQISAMGYKYVEHANYVDRKFYTYSAADFKKVLDDQGLQMPSGHTKFGKEHWDEAKKDFTDSWKYTVEDAAIVGQHYVISPWLLMVRDCMILFLQALIQNWWRSKWILATCMELVEDHWNF